MRRWEKLADGRERLVVDAEDGTNPMFFYGANREEIMEKLAHSVETGQSTINRLRTQPVAPTARTQPAAAARTETRRAAPTADEVMLATQDLSNPGKAPAALKTLLRAGGVDVDQQELDRMTRRVANMAEAWNNEHPDFPTDDRNSRLLIDRATLIAGGAFHRITPEILDRAYAELLQQGMLYESTQQTTTNHTETEQSGGSQTTRTVRPRGATSYRTNGLSSRVPAAQPKPKYTRAEIDAMDTRTFREKVLNVPEVRDWYNRSASAVA